jgi:chromosome segregation ATPase
MPKLKVEPAEHRSRTLDCDWEKLCDELDALHWRAAFALDDESREAHMAAAAEIARELEAVPYRAGFLTGRATLLRALELRSEAQALREAADEHSRRADEAARKLESITDQIDRDCEGVRIRALRSEAERLRAESEALSRNNFFERALEGPRRRIEEAEKQIATARMQWTQKRELRDDRSRQLLPGPNSEDELNGIVEAAERNIADARCEIEVAERAVDVDDPQTWPSSIHNEMTIRAVSVHKQIQARRLTLRAPF